MSRKLSFGTGANVRKSIPNRIVKSRRRVGFSLFPAYFIALARAIMSSEVVSPSPCTIFWDTKAAMSPASHTH